MSRTERHLFVRCPTCRRSGKPGWLWLSGKDYVMCPDCLGTTKVEMIETVFVPTAHSAVVQGLRRVKPAGDTGILVPRQT